MTSLQEVQASIHLELTRMIRVFIWTGNKAHLIDPTILIPGDSEQRETAICGTKPFWPGQWYGNNDEFVAQANALTLCERCVKMAARGVTNGQSA